MKTKTWKKTKIQNLVVISPASIMRARSATNKEIWKSLRTDHYSVAKARLAEFLREHREKQAATVNQRRAKMTFA